MGKLFVVATPIGNLSDISERALTTLKNVDMIAAEDTRRTMQLLNYFSIKKNVISYHKFNEVERGNELITKIINEDINIALVSDAGTPCISDPGATIVGFARKNNVEVIAIPGASSVTAALSVCGFSYDSFTFLGFIPRNKKDKEQYYSTLLSLTFNTFVIFESPNRIVKSLQEIEKIIFDCDLFIINDITKFHEKSFYGNISDVIRELQANEKSNLGEYTIVLHKNKIENTILEKDSDSISLEAMLIDEMVKNNCSFKEAIDIVSKNNDSVTKNQVYKASLNLKELF